MALTYYLTIDGINGGSTNPAHQGAFEISDYSFDVSTLINTVGGQSVPDKATFAPLSIDLDLNSGLTSLLTDLTNGQRIKSLRLEGVVNLGGTQSTVYDLKLGGVVITKYHDTNTGHDNLLFQYNQVILTTTPQNPGGTLGAPVTTSWDILKGTANATVPNPVAGLGNSNSVSIQKYYLTINGINGGSASQSHPGAFEISGYSFDSSILTTLAAGGGLNTSKPSFSPLSINLDLSSGQTQLLSDLASGQIIPSIRLEGVVTDPGGTESTVYDLKLGNVALTQYHETSTGQDTLNFTYSKVALTTTPQNADGSLGKSVTSSWDVTTNRANATIANPVAGAGDSSIPTKKDYYLTIDGLNGGSLSKNHQGTFEVSGFSFDASLLANLSLSSNGLRTGSPDFSPLSIDLLLGPDQTTLFRDFTTSQKIQSIRLQGTVTSPTGLTEHTVYDLKLGDVFITLYHDTNTGLDSLRFIYGKFVLTTTPEHADGTFGTPVTSGWNLETKQAITSANANTIIPNPVIGTAASTGQTTAVNPGGEPKYYLTINGVNGGSSSQSHKGAFEINKYSFDGSSLTTLSAGSKFSISNPTFSPLTIDLDLNSGQTQLLSNLDIGKVIPSIRLEGVITAPGGTEQTFYDLKLGDVVITQYHDTNTGHDTLSFNYSRVILATASQNANGTFGKPVSVGWDIQKGQAITSGNLTSAIPNPVAGLGNSNSANIQKYYLTINGINGGSASQSHPGAFEISGYSFDSSILTTLPANGVSTSKPSFSPLSISLDLNSGQTQLLSDLASGQAIPSIRLEGVVTNPDGTESTVYDLKLGNVALTQYNESSIGQDTLTFTYSKVALTTTPQNADGSLGNSVTSSWDVTANRANASIANPIAGLGGPTINVTPKYYLTIDGSNGGSLSQAHRGAFEVSGFSFDTSTLVTQTGGSGGSSAKPTFAPLSVDLDLSTGQTDLLSDIASGHLLKSIRLEGAVVSSSGIETDVYDLKLGNVFITQYHDTNTGHDNLLFNYGQVVLTTTPENSNGTFGNSTTTSWNIAKGQVGATVSNPVPSNSPPIVSTAIISNKTENDSAYSINLLTGASDAEKNPLTASAVSFSAVDNKNNVVNVSGVTQFNNSLNVDPNAYNFLEAGQFVSITGRYNISDGQGGSVPQTVTVNIAGVNDPATISGTATGTVTEDATTPILTTSGNLTVSDVDTGENKFNTTVTPALGDLGNLSITDTGTWTYSVGNNLVQSLGAGQTKTESFTVTSLDGTATQDINVSINGVNDPATISGTATGTVTEDATTPILTTSGNLTVSDVDTGENKFNTTITSAPGDLGNLSITDTGTWTYSVDNNLVQSLGAGQTKTESFTVKSLDGTASQVINVSINGVNDPATISGTATGTVTEDATTPILTTTGNLTVSDVDTGENKFNTTVTSAPGDLGSLSITDTGTWTYSVGNNLVQSLGAGQTKTESFTVTSLDGTATQDINVSINGVNDPATISGTATGTVTEDATTPILTTSGNLTVSDVDTGENKFNTTITSAPGDLGNLSITDTGTWTYSVGNNLVQSLGAGQTKTESFTVTSLDGTATQDINVSINGVNDPATISGTATGTVTEDATTPILTTSGNLTVSDVDTGENKFNTTITSAPGDLGNLSITDTGTWTYSVDNNLVQSLGAGQTKTESFTVKSLDGTASQVINVSINGVNDPATISGTVTGAVTEDASTPTLTTTGNLTVSDVDTGENKFNTTITSAPGDLGSLSITDTGTWTYSVDNNLVQSLGAGQTKTESFTVTSLDGTVSQDINVSINGVNDSATISGTATGTVTEDNNVVNGTLQTTGNLTVSDVDTGENKFNTTVTSAPGDLGTLSITDTGTWTYSVGNNLVQSLGAGQTKTESFTVTSLDGTATQDINVSINGVNDSATISGTVTGAVTEDATTPNLTTTGNLTVSDVDTGENKFKTTVTSAPGDLGTLSITDTGTWTYSVDNNLVQSLGAGQTKTESFTVTSLDGTVSQDINVSINGVNDSATISGTATGTVTEDNNVVNGTLQTTGNLTVSDVDTGENKFNTTVTSAPGDLGTLSITDTGTWTYSVGNNLVQSLGAGQTKTESFTVTSLDGTATQDINVSINGVNDSATISGTVTGAVTEDASTPTLTTTGNLTVSDVDTGENKFNTTITSAPGDLGSLSITDTGTWTYSVDNNLVQSLGAGQTKTESFTVTSLDGTATQDINVSINGVNDAPVTDPDKLLTLSENAAPTSLNIASPTDIEGDPLSLQVTALPDPSKGQILLNDGTPLTPSQSLSLAELTGLVFSPIPNANGNAGSFSYTVSDGQGGFASQSIALNITPDNTGQSLGDPHIITFDQFHYNFQATGDFILTRSLDTDLEVQVRQAPWVLNPSSTLNVALATMVDGNKVEFYIDQPYPIVDGIALTIQPGQTQALGQGSISRTDTSGYGRLGDLYTIVYPNGDVLANQVFSGFLMDPSLTLSDSPSVVGLLGNNNGNPNDDLALQDGTPLSNPLDPTILEGVFATSWRVSDTQSLFTPASELAPLKLNLAQSGSTALSNNLPSLPERFVFGGNGNDTLIGVQNPLVNPGNGEVDVLTGNQGADTFVLGDANHPYYVGYGQQDFALISDFSSGDSIQLHGNAHDYILGTASVDTVKGMGVFLASDPNELLGLIRGNAVSNLNLNNTSIFHFV